jgi:hypothetical protein
VSRRSSRGPRSCARQDACIGVAFYALAQDLGADAGELVVAAGRSYLALRALGRFPPRSDAPRVLETPEYRVDGAALEPCIVEDIEPVPHAAGQSEQDESRRSSQARAHGIST